MANPIQPVFVDPTFVYARVDSIVKYNLNVTTLKPDEIGLLATNAINEFNDDNLNDFNSTLYESRLIRAIDDSHSSVIANDTKIYIYKKIIPQVNSAQNIDIDFGISLRNDIPQLSNIHDLNELRTVFSSSFILNGEPVLIEDDGIGGLRVMRSNSTGYSFVKNIGTVDYDRGTLQLVNFNCDTFDGQSLRFYALSRDTDITSSFSNILKIDPSEVNIEVETLRQ
jgi:hypothetical protein